MLIDDSIARAYRSRATSGDRATERRLRLPFDASERALAERKEASPGEGGSDETRAIGREGDGELMTEIAAVIDVCSAPRVTPAIT